MPGGGVLLASILLTLASTSVQCTLPKAPEIEVVPKTAPTAYDYTRNLQDLSEIKASTVSPYGGHTEQIVFGLHEGTMNLSYETRMGGTVWEEYGLGCLYYDKIKVTLELNPVIYVVRELKPGSCPHRAVLVHEKKHVKVDRSIANKYAREIGLALQRAVDSVGVIGPFHLAEMEARQAQLGEHIRTVVGGIKHRMVEEQLAAQQAVDSLEEYESISHEISDVCKFDVNKKLKRSLSELERRREPNR